MTGGMVFLPVALLPRFISLQGTRLGAHLTNIRSIVQFIEEKKDYLLLRVRVQPKASANKMVSDPDWGLRVYLTAPPQDGAANKALVAFVAKELGLSRRQVQLVQGEKSRAKTLRLEGVSKAKVLSALT